MKHKAITDPDRRHFGNLDLQLCRIVRMRWSSAPGATDSRHWSEYPNSCRFSGTSPDGNKQTIYLGYKERSSRAGNRGDTRDPSVHRVFRVQNIEEASPATYINARTFGINEQVIGIAAGFGGRDRLAVRHGKDAKFGRRAKDHQAMAT